MEEESNTVVKPEDFLDLPHVKGSKLKGVTYDSFILTINTNQVYDTMSDDLKIKYGKFFCGLLNDKEKFAESFTHLIKNSCDGHKTTKGAYEFKPFPLEDLEFFDMEWKAESGDDVDRLHVHVHATVASRFERGWSFGFKLKEIADLSQLCFGTRFYVNVDVTRNTSLPAQLYVKKHERALAKQNST